MAGLFPGISNSQNIDKNGTPFAYAVLTVFNGGTTQLADVYQDIGLAIPGQNPMTADQTSRLPIFYVADGTYRVRLVDQYGVAIFDYPQVASIGASSSGGGGSAVDPTTIAQTGDVIWNPASGGRTGWVRCNARTIGSATSGASERASSDCQALFLWLWNTFADSICPVVGGRGVSASADWAANKQITLLDGRGIIFAGLTDMGNLDFGIFADVPFSRGNGTTPASLGGEVDHTLVIDEMPAHDHGGETGDDSTAMTGLGFAVAAQAGPHYPLQPTYGPHHHTIASQGGDGAHNNTPLIMTGTIYMKL